MVYSTVNNQIYWPLFEKLLKKDVKTIKKYKKSSELSCRKSKLKRLLVER